LKSSAKITLNPKASKRTSIAPRSQTPQASAITPGVRIESPQRAQSVPKPNATWVCTICSMSNPIPSNFDPASANSRTYLAPCQSCGIKPELLHVIKASLSAGRQSAIIASTEDSNTNEPSLSSSQITKIRCPRCTFANDPSLLQCELCEASLISVPDPRLHLSRDELRSASPGPSLVDLSVNDETTASIKFSFRNGGDKVFLDHMKTALQQRKWLLSGAPPVPRPADDKSDGSDATRDGQNLRKLVGIAGLEMRGQAQRKNNEMIIGNAFEDLEALMTSAKDIIALAEKFAVQSRDGNGSNSESNAIWSQSASALGLTTTKDMLGSDALYISELSRNLAEFLTDDTKGVLKKEGGIMSLVDLWAVFNQARNGVELVSPVDFEKAAQMWEHLKLPLRLRRFKSGLLVVQGRDRTDEKTITSILAWLKELHKVVPLEESTWDVKLYGRGVTVQEAAMRFGWSMGVATEEMDMAEEKGVLCREQGLNGVRFWENWLTREIPNTTG
jgi:ESCRT-II complex subunit VPS36